MVQGGMARPDAVALWMPGGDRYVEWARILFFVPAIFGGIFGLIGGYLTDRLGRRRVLTFSILLYGLSAAAAGFSTSLIELLIFRCLVFIGVCVEFVAAVAWLAELFPNPRQREKVLGFTQAFSSVGGFMVSGAYLLCVKLTNDLPAMLLAVSRLMFAWAEDGIFPRFVAKVHATRHTPHVAIVVSGCMASLGILGSHFAGTFFLGVDILVSAMLVNFLIMCVTVLTLPSRNAELARAVRVVPHRQSQIVLGALGVTLLGIFLATHTWRDLTQPVNAWYFRATWLWLFVMFIGTLIFARERRAMRRRGVDVAAIFRTLPPE